MVQLVQKHREERRVKEEHDTNRAPPIKRERALSSEYQMPLKFSKGAKGEKIYHLDSDEDENEVDIFRGRNGPATKRARRINRGLSDEDDDEDCGPHGCGDPVRAKEEESMDPDKN